METQKYRCLECAEIFDITGLRDIQELTCPRCLSGNIAEYNACSREIGAPPWDYRCQNCDARFRITAPGGPDEAQHIKCPVCRSKNIKWLSLASTGCGSGG